MWWPYRMTFSLDKQLQLWERIRMKIRKLLFGIFTVRRKCLHKHALSCKCKVSQGWMQRNLLVEPGKRLSIAREKHSKVFRFLYEFSLHLLCNVVSKTPFPGSERRYYRYILCRSYSKFIIISIKYVLNTYVYICEFIPIQAHTYKSMYIYTHTHLHILLWLDKEGSKYHSDHWLQKLLRIEAKHCIHLSDPGIFIKA